MFKFKKATALDYQDVLIQPAGPSEHETRNIPLETMFYNTSSVWNPHIELGIPIIAANMFHIGTLEMAMALKRQECHVALQKRIKQNDLKEFIQNLSDIIQNKSVFTRTWVSAGMDQESLTNLHMILKILKDNQQNRKEYICLDVANGYQTKFWSLISDIRERYPEAIIMAGNVATPDVVPEIIAHGADIVKVGIGSGSLCLTRHMTGVGVPQLTALIECGQIAHEVGGLICSDGGCITPGDIPKAIIAGADLVMIGGMFAGFNENEGETINLESGPHKRIYGMSSNEAMQELGGHISKYRAPEGKSVLVPLKGSIDNFLESHIIGGLRGALTLTGCSSLSELQEQGVLVKVNRQLNTSFGDFK